MFAKTRNYLNTRGLLGSQIVPWVDCSTPFKLHDPATYQWDHIRNALKDWSKITNTAIVHTILGMVNYVYPYVFEGTGITRRIGGLKTHHYGKFDGGVDWWIRLARTCRGMMNTLGSKVVLLDVEDAIRDHLTGKNPISQDYLAEWAKNVREAMPFRVWWYDVEVQPRDHHTYTRSRQLFDAIADRRPNDQYLCASTSGYRDVEGPPRPYPAEMARVRCYSIAYVTPSGGILNRRCWTPEEFVEAYRAGRTFTRLVVVNTGLEHFATVGKRLAELLG
jgi:hypothetical protein